MAALRHFSFRIPRSQRNRSVAHRSYRESSTCSDDAVLSSPAASLCLSLRCHRLPDCLRRPPGSISGHVADSTGAVIPDANVTLTNVGTGASRTTVTTGAGDYTFPDVPPAIYKIQVTHEGFKTATSQNVELQVQQSLRQDFTMAVGAVTQSVTVRSDGRAAAG